MVKKAPKLADHLRSMDWEPPNWLSRHRPRWISGHWHQWTANWTAVVATA